MMGGITRFFEMLDTNINVPICFTNTLHFAFCWKTNTVVCIRKRAHILPQLFIFYILSPMMPTEILSA